LVGRYLSKSATINHDRVVLTVSRMELEDRERRQRIDSILRPCGVLFDYAEQCE
jgi:hypothetical protein